MKREETSADQSWLLNNSTDAASVEQYYDEWSDRYDGELGEWDYRSPDETARLLARYCVTSARILDAGCGTGLSGRALAAAGFDDAPDVTVSVTGSAHTDSASTGVELTAPSSCAEGDLPTGRTFVYIEGSEREWYPVWCDAVSHGGGWTVFHPSDLGHLGVDPDTLRTDLDTVLVWITRNDGAQFTTLLSQLPAYASYDVSSRSTGSYVEIEFIPRDVADVAGQTQGFRSNGQDLTFVNCDANPNSYFRFYQSGQTSSHQPSTNDYNMSYRWRNTKTAAQSPIPADFYAYTELHQGGCGTFSTSNRWPAYDNTTGAALGIR